MAAEGESVTASATGGAEEGGMARSWARVASHLEAAIGAIPRPNWKAITDPKEMGKNLRKLCKALKKQLKEVMQETKDMSVRVYALLKQLAAKIADLISSFFDYICDKVKKFYHWISGIIQSFKARFAAHVD